MMMVVHSCIDYYLKISKRHEIVLEDESLMLGITNEFLSKVCVKIQSSKRS